MAHVAALTPARPELAALAFVGIPSTDTPGEMARGGECLFVQGTSGAGFVSVDWQQGRAWIVGAAGRGGILAEGLAGIEQAARQRGAVAVGFATFRRALVRRAKALGYEITGTDGGAWIMEKGV